MVAKPKLTTLRSAHQPPVLQAADYVMTLLKHTRTNSLAAMLGKIEAEDEAVIAKLQTIVITEAQMALIEEHSADMSLIRNSPSVTLSRCTVCGKVSAVAAPSRKCALTLGCTGAAEKSGQASKVAYPPADTDSAADSDGIEADDDTE